MGKQAYIDERERRLAFDPRCAENYARYRRARRTPNLDYLPVKLDIENVSRCNFRCTMCQVSDWAKGKRADDLPIGEFTRLIDEQYGLVEIKLQGIGEPLLGAPELFDMIRYVRERHIWVRLTTNASLLHLKENYKHLIDSDPNEVQISIDGATKDVFEGIRRGSRFETVMDNCKKINAYSRERGVRRTKMWTVVQAGNVHQVPDLVELAAELGFTSMVFSLDIGDWGQQSWQDRNGAAMANSGIAPELAERLVMRGRELGVTVAFWTIADKYDWMDESKLCPWPFERAYISSDQRVVPCCMIANPETYELGDAKNLPEVWTGETMQAFRAAHISGALPDICRNCYVEH